MATLKQLITELFEKSTVFEFFSAEDIANRIGSTKESVSIFLSGSWELLDPELAVHRRREGQRYVYYRTKSAKPLKIPKPAFELPEMAKPSPSPFVKPSDSPVEQFEQGLFMAAKAFREHMAKTDNQLEKKVAQMADTIAFQEQSMLKMTETMKDQAGLILSLSQELSELSRFVSDFFENETRPPEPAVEIVAVLQEEVTDQTRTRPPIPEKEKEPERVRLPKICVFGLQPAQAGSVNSELGQYLDIEFLNPDTGTSVSQMDAKLKTTSMAFLHIKHLDHSVQEKVTNSGRPYHFVNGGTSSMIREIRSWYNKTFGQ